MINLKILKKNKKHKYLLLKEDAINHKNIKKFRIISKNKKKNTFDININFLIKLLIPILLILLITFIILQAKIRKQKSAKKIIHENNITNLEYNINNIINISNINNLNKISNQKNNYFACFVTLGRQENKYIKELIEYYIKLGVEKFIFADNNIPNTEKLSDVVQDYISNGTVEIIELFGSDFGLAEFYNITYERYKAKCNLFVFFDFDEYLEIFFEKGKNLVLKEFLTNSTFDKCEAILFNWVIYSDNDLIYYDNRTLNERFPEPYFQCRDNVHVKTILRGGLNKTVFLEKKSNHVPEKGVTICDSKGNIRQKYNAFAISPPIYDYGYIKHFTTKTAEEYTNKILRGLTRNRKLRPEERVKLFFQYNKFSEEKLKVFENKFNLIYYMLKL